MADYYYDSDDDSDDGVFGINMKPKVDIGSKRYLVNEGNYSKWSIPTKLWRYHYIVNTWKDTISDKGIGEKRLKSFFSDEYLVNGSPNGGIETRWSKGHEFWEGVIEATGHKAIFFSGDAIDELCELLAEQCDQTPKSSIKPNPEQSLRVKSAIEPKSLKAITPKDTNELHTMIESVTGEYFSLVLAQSRQCWAQILAKGGSALTLKTQRYEGDDRVVLEIGWSLLQYKEVNGQMMEREDVQHIIVTDNIRYRNGLQLPDNRNYFGYGTTIQVDESQVTKQLEKTINDLARDGPVMLVLHDASKEISYFEEFLDTSKWDHALPADMHRKLGSKKSGGEVRYPIVIQDTQRLYAAYKGNPTAASVALKRACDDFNIETQRMNNAGNESYYMTQLYYYLVSGTGSYSS